MNGLSEVWAPMNTLLVAPLTLNFSLPSVVTIKRPSVPVSITSAFVSPCSILFVVAVPSSVS